MNPEPLRSIALGLLPFGHIKPVNMSHALSKFK